MAAVHGGPCGGALGAGAGVEAPVYADTPDAGGRGAADTGTGGVLGALGVPAGRAGGDGVGTAGDGVGAAGAGDGTRAVRGDGPRWHGAPEAGALEPTAHSADVWFASGVALRKKPRPPAVTTQTRAAAAAAERVSPIRLALWTRASVLRPVGEPKAAATSAASSNRWAGSGAMQRAMTPNNCGSAS